MTYSVVYQTGQEEKFNAVISWEDLIKNIEAAAAGEVRKFLKRRGIDHLRLLKE